MKNPAPSANPKRSGTDSRGLLESARRTAFMLIPLFFLLAILGVQDGAVAYERDIAPIFEARCVECHGAEKHKSGLRLDSAARALAGSDNGEYAVIEPGDSAESLLYELVSSPDEDERMPPEGDPLTGDQLELLRRWIDEGARVPEEAANETEARHWAYVPPLRPAAPEVEGDWPRSELDRFVLARMRKQGLEPSPEADRATLLRRLALDLTGLPPSLAELDAFLADDTPDAYERAVERLLSSPAYGERMARGWLDLARYADTNGFEKDERRTMWRWREWVIAAFNADLPFDRFTIEQLAGDLLPGATLEQRIATGFHRNTMVNAEGGVDPEEYRVAAVVDRVNTTGSVWMGTTLACARCHTHKFDPISQREYFRLFAYFNSTADIGPTDQPRMEAPTPEEARVEARAAEEQARLEAKLSTWTPELEQELEDYARDQGTAVEDYYASVNGPRVLSLIPGRSPTENGTVLTVEKSDGTIQASGELPERDTYELEVWLDAAPLRNLRIDVLTDDSLPGGGPGRASHGNFVLSEVTAELDSGGEPRPLTFHAARADYHQLGPPAWPARAAIDGDPATGWAIGGDVHHSHRLELEFEQPVEDSTGAVLRVRLSQLYGGQHLIGRLRVSVSSAPVREAQLVAPPDIEEWLGVESSATTEDDLRRLRDWFLANTPSLVAERARLEELRARARPATTLVMQELEKPRVTHVLERGSFLSPGEQVEVGVPAVMGALPADAEPNRLGLARWLVSGEHPLTARVTVNRLWAQVFGRGLVATEGDFGSQGSPPTHPALLDWLAREFVEGGWSVKHLMRTLVLSATYRQSSVVTPEGYAADSQNLWLARGARYRVEAEMLRDLALAASGLLDRTIGGPSVFPPQPEGIWQMTYSGERWETATDERRFRRGLYTFWRRTAPYPTFMAFDAPSRELACIRRERSNTPLQALALLNDPAFVEAAVGLAARILREGGDAATKRAAFGFRLCTGRAPAADELEVLLELHESERTHFEHDAQAASALVAVPFELDASSLDPPELAAWTVVANVLLNLDETVTRD